MTRIASHLSANWQAWGIIAAVFSLGFTLAWNPIRQDVHAIEVDVENQGDALVEFIERASRIEADVARIKCVVEAQALEVDPVSRCGL